MPEKTLEEIAAGTSEEERGIFDEHMRYRSLSSMRKMKSESFEGQEGGTEKIFDDVYHTVNKMGDKTGIKGKADQKSIADTLELIITNSLERMGVAEKQAVKIFESVKNAKQFKDDSERIGHLTELAGTYLGIDVRSEAWRKLLANLEAGDTSLWSESIRNFTDYLKNSVIEAYIGKHLQKTMLPGREHKFTAYLIKHHLGEKYGLEPEKLGIDLLRGPEPMLHKVSVLEQEKDPARYKQLGVRAKKDHYKKAD